MLRQIIPSIALFTMLLVACSNPESHNDEAKHDDDSHKEMMADAPNDYRADIEKAHKKAEFLSKDAVQFNIKLSFGGNERLNGLMTLATNSSNGKVEMADGSKIFFNQDKVYCPADNENPQGARFAAYTWSYFFLFPYKLSDDGTVWNNFNNDSLNGKLYNSHKLTFNAGTGDAPDDWYVVYNNKNNNLVHAAAYIVTAGGTPVDKAEENPHAIEYAEYKNIDGIPIAQSWKYWVWSENEGLTQQIGEAQLSNIKFVESTPTTFTAPEGYMMVE